MADARLSLEGLPMPIAIALTRFFLAACDIATSDADDTEAFRATGANCAQLRAKLVEAIKDALEAKSLLAPATIGADAPLETSEADAREPRRELLPIGDDFPEVARRCASVDALLAEHGLHAEAKTCACFDGLCRCEVVAGRTSTGLHCKAQLQDGLLQPGAPEQTR